ncbi:TonB-dependent receptor [Bacteroides gallinaceum]|uniref:TonB-dependent receptor n=1 Tax=Bacteroides gallinaceum TaxID=1462571 RepID=UPI003F541E12
MKRMILIIGLAAFGAGLPAQEAADSLLTGDVQTDSLFQALPEVLVEGERPVVRALPGRLEYDLPRMIAQKPIDNVYDALKELPGVVEMNGGLTLGARGVTVILDGKVTNMSVEQLYSLLKSMPASRIERVEVMYNAPARYQVRGALINVRLRHRIGDPGLVQGEAFAKYDQRHEASFEERASFLYNGGKLSADFLYSHTHGESYHTTDKEARHWQEAEGEAYSVRNHERGHGRNHTHTFRLGAGYRFSENHSLDFVYNGSYDTSHYNQYTTGTQTATTLGNQEAWLHDGRLDYQAPFGLKAGAEFTWYHAPGSQRLVSEMDGTSMDFYTEDAQRINAWKFYVSQEHQLRHGWGLNYGAVYTTSVDNSYQRYSGNEGLPSDMDSRRRERMLNVYAGFSKSFGEDLSVDFSLAAERYRTPVWDEWSWYPNLTAMYKPSASHIVQLSFSSDKRYPGYWAVQDAVSYLGGGYSEVQGNPLLKPSKDYDVRLVYVLKSKYIFSAWFSHTEDYATQTLYQSPERLVEIYRYLNFDFQRQAGIQASVPFKVKKWLDSRLTLIGVWMREKDNDFYDMPFDRRICYGMAVWNNTVTLSTRPDLRLTLNGFVRSKAHQGTYDLPASGNVDIALRYAFAGKNCILSAWCKDIFETAGIDPYIRLARQWVTNDYSCYRSVGLSFTWKFGGYQEKRREAVDTSRFK